MRSLGRLNFAIPFWSIKITLWKAKSTPECGFTGFCETCFPKFSGYHSKMGFWLLSHTGDSWKSHYWFIFDSVNGSVGLIAVWAFQNVTLLCSSLLGLECVGEGNAGAHHGLARWVRVCKHKRWPWPGISFVQSMTSGCPVSHKFSGFFGKKAARIGPLLLCPACHRPGEWMVSSLHFFSPANCCRRSKLELC